MDNGGVVSRRRFIGALGTVAGATALAPIVVKAQAPPAKPADPASTITAPPRDWSPNANPTTYVDPDVITINPLFNRYRQGNTPIKRLWTGALWSEGPAWSGQGRYLVWSDIPNNRQLRWLEDDGSVRMPSNNSNGNTFDFQGRQLSCEHLTTRVVRYEHDGSITIIADSYNASTRRAPPRASSFPARAFDSAGPEPPCGPGRPGRERRARDGRGDVDRTRLQSLPAAARSHS